jgi:hypothetical protein
MAIYELKLPDRMDATTLKAMILDSELSFRDSLDAVARSLTHSGTGIYEDGSLGVQAVHLETGRVDVVWTWREPKGCSEISATQNRTETWGFSIEAEQIRLVIPDAAVRHDDL